MPTKWIKLAKEPFEGELKKRVLVVRGDSALAVSAADDRLAFLTKESAYIYTNEDF